MGCQGGGEERRQANLRAPPSSAAADAGAAIFSRGHSASPPPPSGALFRSPSRAAGREGGRDARRAARAAPRVTPALGMAEQASCLLAEWVTHSPRPKKKGTEALIGSSLHTSTALRYGIPFDHQISRETAHSSILVAKREGGVKDGPPSSPKLFFGRASRRRTASRVSPAPPPPHRRPAPLPLATPQPSCLLACLLATAPICCYIRKGLQAGGCLLSPASSGLLLGLHGVLQASHGVL